jgi:hypothetical protein
MAGAGYAHVLAALGHEGKRALLFLAPASPNERVSKVLVPDRLCVLLVSI